MRPEASQICAFDYKKNNIHACTTYTLYLTVDREDALQNICICTKFDHSLVGTTQGTKFGRSGKEQRMTVKHIPYLFDNTPH